MGDKKKVGAGFGVMMLKDGKVLLGRRHENPDKADTVFMETGTWMRQQKFAERNFWVPKYAFYIF